MIKIFNPFNQKKKYENKMIDSIQSYNPVMILYIFRNKMRFLFELFIPL